MAQEKYTLGQAGIIATIVALLVPLMVVLAFPLTIYCAWCDMLVWNWFAAPYFHLPLMSLWVSLGIGLWVRSQTNSYTVYKDLEARVWMGLFTMVASHTLMLLTAYLVRHYALHL